MTSNNISKKEKRVNVSLPVDLIIEAQKITGSNLTSTLKAAIETLIKSKSSKKILSFKGKLKGTIDLENLRKD
jgi:hypothetical protein